MSLITHNASLVASKSDLREQWVVYLHFLHPSPEPFYAGVCKLNDVFKHPDALRNTHWRSLVSDQTVINTTILASSDKSSECWDHHTFVVRELRPVSNVVGYVAAGKTMITCIMGPNKGKTYHTQEACAVDNGISQPSLSNHLNGRQGYTILRGMQFMRGTPHAVT